MNRLLHIVFLLSLFSFPVLGMDIVSLQEKEAQKKINKIGMHQIGIGVHAAYWTNFRTGVSIQYLLGSSRNLFNFRAGVGYELCLPIKADMSSSLYGHYIPITFGGHCNYVRWDRQSAYISAEASCYANVGNQQLHRTYFSLSGGLGIRYNALDISVMYTYDLKPSFDQKYIYEHLEYDFDGLHRIIYERMRIELRLAYYFTLGL